MDHPKPASPLVEAHHSHPTAPTTRDGGPGSHPTAPTTRDGGPGSHPTAPTTRGRGPGCEHLRHKGMYVLTVADPDEHVFYDSYDATAYWCTKTMRGIGPDGKRVHRDQCHDGRDCCQH